MKLTETVLHEWKTRLSRPAALVSLALFTAVMIYGAVSGRIDRDTRLENISKHRADIAAAMEKWRNDLRALERNEADAPPWSGSAMDVTFASYLPPAPLGDFAIGQSDLLPYLGALSLWNPDIRLFSKYEFEDPVSLALGAFDLGKAIVLVLPLLMIVLSFDVLSSERDANRLSLILAQGARVQSLFWRRLAIRAGAVVVLMLIIALLALILHAGAASVPQRLPFFTLWMLCAFLYAAFWIAVIGFVASKNRRGGINLIVLLLLWATFTLILPAGVTAVAETVYPTPSRLAYLAEAREKENETTLAEADIANRFVLDHPELLIDDSSAIPDYVRTAFFVTTTVDAATRPILDSFEYAATRRDRTLSLLRYCSPAIIAHRLFNDVAGTSSARHRRYMAAARAHKAAYAGKVGPYVVAGKRLDSRESDYLTDFAFEDEQASATIVRNAGALLYLAFATGFLLLFADSRLCRIRGSGP